VVRRRTLTLSALPNHPFAQHGFCAARGDYKNEVVTQRVAEAVQLLAGFFTSNVA
jgi:hypothetical protein